MVASAMPAQAPSSSVAFVAISQASFGLPAARLEVTHTVVQTTATAIPGAAPRPAAMYATGAKYNGSVRISSPVR